MTNHDPAGLEKRIIEDFPYTCISLCFSRYKRLIGHVAQVFPVLISFNAVVHKMFPMMRNVHQ